MYKAMPIKSNSKSIDSIEDWSQLTEHFKDEEAKAVIWYYDKIEFCLLKASGKWDSSIRTDLNEEVVRIRIFNENKEVHIWRSKGKLVGRCREDQEPSTDIKEEVFDEYVKSEQQISKSSAFTNGGMLVARNYIGYNEIGQAGFVDSRFCAIKILEK